MKRPLQVKPPPRPLQVKPLAVTRKAPLAVKALQAHLEQVKVPLAVTRKAPRPPETPPPFSKFPGLNNMSSQVLQKWRKLLVTPAAASSPSAAEEPAGAREGAAAVGGAPLL